MAESAATYDPGSGATVEMVELAEQSEPLMQRRSTAVGQEQSCKEDDPLSPTSPPQSAHNMAASKSVDEGDGHSMLLAGGIPKNRKRPGSAADGQRVTMTGTVTRGNSVGQPVEVQLELTETEFLRLTSREPEAKSEEKCECSKRQGPHIVLWSFLCIPVAMVISLCLSFYNGSMTWYNLIIYFSEEKSVLHKVTLCPLIILSFPLTVGLSSLLISLVASVMQVSWSWRRWWAEICDGEKGFYGWVCSKIGLPNCSPYQVVVLDDTNT